MPMGKPTGTPTRHCEIQPPGGATATTGRNNLRSDPSCSPRSLADPNQPCKHTKTVSMS
jgi:hypothetical protein